jgi:hypothetical protein
MGIRRRARTGATRAGVEGSGQAVGHGAKRAVEIERDSPQSDATAGWKVIRSIRAEIVDVRGRLAKGSD